MSSDTTGSVVSTDGITKQFGGVRALNGCSVGVYPARVTGVIGPNGSGKTTLFNIMSGYMAPDQGSVLVHGRTVARITPRRMFELGVVRTFQYARLFPELTAVEVLALAIRKPVGALLHQRVEPDDLGVIMATLERVGLGTSAGKQAGQLSYGQQRLLEFATTIVGSPEVVLLDEPAAGVNPAMVEQLGQHIGALRAEGVGVLVVEHQLDFIMSLCDEVTVLANGTVIATGPPDSVAEDPAVLDAYLGV